MTMASLTRSSAVLPTRGSLAGQSLRQQSRVSQIRPVPRTRGCSRHGLVTRAIMPASAMPALPEGQKPLAIAMAGSIAGAMKEAAHRLSTAFKNATDPENIDSEEVNKHVKSAFKTVKIIWMVAPFAAVSASGGTTNTFLLITRAVASFIKLYLLLLFLRVLLSWFPTFDWMKQPWLALRQVTDPYLNLFRGIVPPLLGTIDFTPLLGFFILQFLAGALDLGYEEDSW